MCRISAGALSFTGKFYSPSTDSQLGLYRKNSPLKLAITCTSTLRFYPLLWRYLFSQSCFCIFASRKTKCFSSGPTSRFSRLNFSCFCCPCSPNSESSTQRASAFQLFGFPFLRPAIFNSEIRRFFGWGWFCSWYLYWRCCCCSSCPGSCSRGFCSAARAFAFAFGGTAC